jgi:hypothetical protein
MNMKAVAKLVKDPKHRADVLNLARSLYENYLTMVYTRKQPHKMAEIFDAKAGLKHGWFEYCLNKNGEIDRRRAKEKRTGKVVSLEISKKEMARSSDYEEDLKIYNYLYDYLSGYTHADVGVMFDYLSEAERDLSGDGNYSEFMSEAVAFPLLITTFILDEARKTNIVNDVTKSDVVRFLEHIVPKLSAFFGMRALMYEDEDYGEIIQARLRKISTSS